MENVPLPIAQLDIVVSRFKVKFLEFSGHSRVAAIHINGGILRLGNDLDVACAGNRSVGVVWRPPPAPAVWTIPTPTRSVVAVTSAYKYHAAPLGRGRRRQGKRRQKGNSRYFPIAKHSFLPSLPGPVCLWTYDMPRPIQLDAQGSVEMLGLSRRITPGEVRRGPSAALQMWTRVPARWRPSSYV